jgi:alkanesulfonate monooxygenase SsuD/methylene tetrahydromethanopterin reductase-like flavin-dependent oxidoreductase (luciferase family)
VHVGLSVMFQGLAGPSQDRRAWRHNLAIADQAEPRGFDSVWTPEHHFSDYVMSPNPAQFLTWMAARTSRVRLGSMVMVLPWHDPVRVAEELTVLDNVSDGRTVLGLGRGLGPIEFDGFRVEMGESRGRFVEYAEAITSALETGHMEYHGELYKQAPVDLRPQPVASWKGRIYASAVSPESALIMARLGYGLMIIAQKPWETTIKEIDDYRALYEKVNAEPPPKPLLVNFVNVHEDSARAAELQEEYGIAYSRSAVAHYDFTNPRLAEVPGYEYYARLREGIEKRGIETFARFLAQLQIIGTPDEVVEQTIERIRLIDGGGVINVFSFGGMPEDVAWANLDLYTKKVLPLIKAADPHREIPAARHLAQSPAEKSALA